MVNTEELRAVLAHIKAHPKTWNQEHWAWPTPCGTAHCFAGHAVVRAGYHIVGQVAHHPTPGVPDEPARRVAKRILGLTDVEADRLFYCYNALEDLERIVEELCAEAEQGVVSRGEAR